MHEQLEGSPVLRKDSVKKETLTSQTILFRYQHRALLIKRIRVDHLSAQNLAVYLLGGQTYSHNTFIVFISKHAIDNELCFSWDLLGQLTWLAHYVVR